MSAGGIEKLCEQLAELVASNTLMAFENWQGGIASPIERIFCIGLWSFVDLRSWEYEGFSSVVVRYGGRDLSEQDIAQVNKHGVILLEYQKNELSWRADFVLSVPSLSSRKMIVECDGHQFHERTKEQAVRDRSRDREAQAAGYSILRFTGSELYRDPLKCVREVLDVLKQTWGA